MASLKQKTISGILWSFLQKVGSRGISFIVMILLARLLTPKAFGLIGMIMIFVQISQAVIDGGFKLALIQKKNTDDLDFSSIFWINLIISLLIYIIIYITAPYISNFYDQSSLTKLVRALSLVFVFNAFSLIQETRLTKEIRFKTLMLVHIPSSIIGGIISVIMAYQGYGVWSIVAFYVVSRLVYAIQIWIYAKWKPQFIFHWTRIKQLFHFGSRLLIERIITVLYNNIILVVIGKFYPVESVGYYQNSFNLVSQPSNTITGVLNGVTFSAFSTIQEDNQKLRTGYSKAIQQALFILCPAYIFAGVLATPLFELVFGAKWLPAVPYFQWLCIIGIFTPLTRFNLEIVNIKGRSDVFLKLQLIRRGGTILAIIAAFPLGIMALVIVQSTSFILAFLLFSYYSEKFIGYSIKSQLRDITPMFLVSVFSALVIYSLNNFAFVGITNWLKLIFGFGVGGFIYFSIFHFLGLQTYVEFKNILFSRIKR